MYIFSIKRIFIFQIIIYYIKSLEDIKIWKKEYKIVNPLDNNKNQIIAYILDDETHSEIFLTNNKNNNNNMFLNNGKEIITIKNKVNLIGFKSPLIEYNSNFYFCSSSETFNWIIGKEIFSAENPLEIDKLNKKFKIKCLRGYDSVVLAYLGTKYLFWFDVKINNYTGFNFSFEDSRIFLAINNYPDNNNGNSNEYKYTSLSMDDNNYYFNIFKKSNEGIINEKQKAIPKENWIFYENIEIITVNIGDIITYVFSYDTNSGNFTFYQVPVEDNRFYFNGKYYLRFFNDFKIKYAKFIEKTSFLYYSIESRKNDRKSYIGLVDLQYYLVIYNIEEKVDGNIYFNYGNAYKDKENLLFYFSENQQILFCPFIKDGEDCKFENEYFDIIQNKDNIYENVHNSNNCNGKKILGPYCVYNCSSGFVDNGIICSFCNVFSNMFTYFKSKECIEKCDLPYKLDFENRICYDCNNPKVDDNRIIFYENNCIENCKEVFGEDFNNSCISCKNKNNSLFSLENEICIEEKECDGEIDYYLNTCKECSYFNQVFFNGSCVDKCGPFYGNKNNVCELCDNDNNEYSQEGYCVKECNYAKGYGFININYKDKNYKYCEKCIDYPTKTYLQDEFCVTSCMSGISNSDKICKSCKPYFYIEKAESCTEKCPNGSALFANSVCSFCQEYGLYYYNNECRSKCNSNQYIKISRYSNGKYSLDYEECIDCSGVMVNGRCVDCGGEYYNFLFKQCYKCFCGNKFKCLKSEGQCDCSEDINYYGYSCEFYTKEDKNKKSLKIISLNDKLIKTSKNYFTFELKDNIILENDYSISWKILLNGEEIVEDKNKKYFITATNEKVLGINKELFEKPYYNKNIDLSLNIINNGKIINDRISLILIDSFEYENECKKSGDLGYFEMKTDLYLENIKKNEIYKGRYMSQYRLLDFNNEKIPLTPYIELDKININLICSKGFDINTINDREENQESFLFKADFCQELNLDIEEIFESNYFDTEKIFLLISYIRKNKINEYDKILKINNFINNKIQQIINNNGYYIDIEENSEEHKNTSNELRNEINKNITYTEPKLIFSLMNYLAGQSKNILNEKRINLFFNYTKNVFEIIFNNNESSFYNKSLSDSDIKSLFRTVDNLYDISIEKNFNSKTNINNFITVFDNITRYLSYKTYPSETMRLIGNRISILHYHLGEHQKDMSFPFIENMDKIKINDFLTYAYDNYNLRERICSQKNSTLFCFTQEDYKDLINRLKINYNLNNVILNIYLLQEINSNNEIIKNQNYYYDENYEKFTINKNYSIIYKLFIKENNNYDLIENNDIDIKLDVEFPFAINISENEIKKEKNEKIENNIFSEENYFEKKGWEIPLNPNNSEYTCIPKSYYEDLERNNEKDNNNIKYFCSTHFNYEQKKVRCSCKTKLNDEILIIKDKTISEHFKHLQFNKNKIKIMNKYTLSIIYIFNFLLLSPIIYYLIVEIIKEKKANEDLTIKESEEEERKENIKKKYNYLKNYYNTRIFRFAFFLTLKKFPLFYPFNKYKHKYPIIIKHLIICIGFFIGIIISLIPFYFISFPEKQIFIDQRDINFNDETHKNIEPIKYFIFSIFFCLIGVIFTYIFIYVFSKILNYQKEENEAWLKIKKLFKDYVYNDIKSEVLLGSIWKKIKLRMLSYYYICRNFSLNNIDNKFTNYLKYIRGNNDYYNYDVKGINEAEIIFPKIESKKTADLKMILEEDEKKENLLDNNKSHISNDDIFQRRRRNKKSLFNSIGRRLSKKSNFSNQEKIKIINNFYNLKIDKTENFVLSIKEYDETKKQIEHFEKIRNKYIYIPYNRGINEIEGLFENESQNQFLISKQINYSIYSVDSFDSLVVKQKDSDKITYNFIKISAILFGILIIMLIIMIFLLRKLLERFGPFIVKVWIIPSLLIFVIINLFLFYLKMLIGAVLLFHFYHLRKKRGYIGTLFAMFVDKTMIYVFKVRNLVTKYKREFDYL